MIKGMITAACAAAVVCASGAHAAETGWTEPIDVSPGYL
jgi:hypothetical protein